MEMKNIYSTSAREDVLELSSTTRKPTSSQQAIAVPYQIK
jgi:hypothetical protein